MLGDLPLLADENIQDAVIAKLRAEGREVYSVMEEGLQEADDKTILRYAHERDWVVLTHDSDFGALDLVRYPADECRAAFPIDCGEESRAGTSSPTKS